MCICIFPDVVCLHLNDYVRILRLRFQNIMPYNLCQPVLVRTGAFLCTFASCFWCTRHKSARWYRIKLVYMRQKYMHARVHIHEYALLWSASHMRKFMGRASPVRLPVRSSVRLFVRLVWLWGLSFVVCYAAAPNAHTHILTHSDFAVLSVRAGSSAGKQHYACLVVLLCMCT